MHIFRTHCLFAPRILFWFELRELSNFNVKNPDKKTQQTPPLPDPLQPKVRKPQRGGIVDNFNMQLEISNYKIRMDVPG